MAPARSSCSVREAAGLRRREGIPIGHVFRFLSRQSAAYFP